MHLIDQSFAMFNKLGLKEVGNLEQTVATGVDATGGLPSSIEIFNSVVALMSGPKLAPQDKLRMAILLVSSVNLNESELLEAQEPARRPGRFEDLRQHALPEPAQQHDARGQQVEAERRR
jgi:hypothetical protein